MAAQNASAQLCSVAFHLSPQKAGGAGYAGGWSGCMLGGQGDALR